MSTTTCSSLVPSKKSQRVSYDESHCISDLPEWAISNILSRLHTKVAVRTSVLSKDWEYKWTSVDNLTLDDGIARKNTKKPFMNFVERALFLAHSVQSLCLSCSKEYDLHRTKTWISAALSRDVHFLQIRGPQAIVLPRNLLGCCLRKLDLNMPCTLKVHAEICFAHLTTLRLVGVRISNELSNLDLVKFMFPVLETFELIRCKWLNVKCVEIFAPKMTSFESETQYNDPCVNDYSIKIMGHGLVRFKCRGGVPENIVLVGSTVSYASLGIYGFGSNSSDLIGKSRPQIWKLLKSFTSIQELDLAGLVAKAISQSNSRLSLPKYYDMERLLITPPGTGEALLLLLHAAPSLKFLHIYLSEWRDYEYDEERVPSCVVSELEEVKFNWFGGEIHEVKLVKYFVKNASQLKRLCLVVRTCPQPLIQENTMAEELLTCCRASTCLTIDVT